jgi:hypothetical protein
VLTPDSDIPNSFDLERVRQDLGRPLENGEKEFTYGINFPPPSANPSEKVVKPTPHNSISTAPSATVPEKSGGKPEHPAQRSRNRGPSRCGNLEQRSVCMGCKDDHSKRAPASATETGHIRQRGRGPAREIDLLQLAARRALSALESIATFRLIPRWTILIRDTGSLVSYNLDSANDPRGSGAGGKNARRERQEK